MKNNINRRRFVLALGGGAVAIAAQGAVKADNLNAVSTGGANRVAADISLGYAAITWGGQDMEAIKDISALGFRGIQLRSNILKDFGERPRELRDLLAASRLELVALSSGGVGAAAGEEDLAKHVNNARFMRDVGGRYLQVTDGGRPAGREPAPDDFVKLGRALTELGKRTADLSVPLGYHNHMGTLGQGPREVDAIMDASDSRYVKLELDVAHYFQGGGDPAAAIRKYRDRLLFLHIKDVEGLKSAAANADAQQKKQPAYRFVELGRGKVDLPAVFAALKGINFRGWAVVELDDVPDHARTPKESAQISKMYLEKVIGLKV